MTNLTESGGYAKLAGNKVLYYTPSDVDKGIYIPEQPDVKPKDEYRASSWYSTKPSVVEAEETDFVDIKEDTWLRRRVRDNQKGLKASENIHGVEWYDVSSIQQPEKQTGVRIAPEIYNINGASFLSGQSQLPPDLGRNLGQSRRVLQRAPRDLLNTSCRTHNDQTVFDPSGIVSGNEGIKLK